MNPVGWFEIYVKDIEAAKKFYEGVFNITLEKLASPADDVTVMWTFPMDPQGKGASGALITMEGEEQPTGNGTIVYFTCADCAVEELRVVPNGGRVMKGKFSIGPHGFISLVYDPDGNVIGLHSRI